MSVKHLYLVAVAATISCTGANSTSSPVTTVPPRRANFLANTEIITAHADVGTAYDAVERLRPNWLSAHGLSTFDLRASEFAVVFVNGERSGGLDSLRGIPAYQVADMRYYDVTEAGARFGIKGGSGGVIDIRLK